jgi:hypothetical protein
LLVANEARFLAARAAIRYQAFSTTYKGCQRLEAASEQQARLLMSRESGRRQRYKLDAC